MVRNSRRTRPQDERLDPRLPIWALDVTQELCKKSVARPDHATVSNLGCTRSRPASSKVGDSPSTPRTRLAHAITGNRP